MSVITSVISATDLELFKNLANPVKVDIRQNPQTNRNTKPDIPPTTINGGDDGENNSGGGRGDGGRENNSGGGRGDGGRENNSGGDHSRGGRENNSGRGRGDGGGGHSRGHGHHSRSPSRSYSRHSNHPRRSSAMSMPVSPPASSHGSERMSPRGDGTPSRRPPRRSSDKISAGTRNSHSRSRSNANRHRRHDRSSMPDENSDDRRTDYPDITQRAIPDHNPFQSSFLSPFPTQGSRRSPGRPSPNRGESDRRSSLFDQETQRYLRGSSPDVRVKLPFHDRGPTMSIPTTAAHPRFFSPNPLNNPNLLDPVISPRRPSRNHSRSKRHSRHRHRRSNSRHSNHRDDEISGQEKRKYLLDLEKLKLQGIKLTKDYTMNDSLADIRFEYDSHRSNYDVVDSINYMKDILGFSFTLIESLNQRFGPILQLRGWSTYMKTNMGRFDRLLERAYHRFWRQGQPSPFMEFGFLVFGTMIMWHLQNKYLHGLPVSEMLGVMGGGGGGNTGGTHPGTMPNLQTGVAANNGGSGIPNTGGGFSLGNIMRMFTGGNANRPSPPQTNPTQQHTMPAIVPPIPNPPASDAQRAQVSQIPTASAPVPPSGFAATLPPMNVRGIPSHQNQSQSNPPQRRMLRRPSAHLRDDNPSRSPLSPVQESTHESDIPAPP